MRILGLKVESRIARWWRKWWKFLKWDQLLRAQCEKSTYRERPSEKRIPPKWCNRRSIDLVIIAF